MRGTRVGGIEAFQTFIRPPLSVTPAFLGLLGRVVTRCTQAPDVGIIPEQRRIASVRNLVVRYQLRRVDLASLAHLASEQVTQKDRPTQALPSCRAIPAPPRCRSGPVDGATYVLAFRCKPRRLGLENRSKPRKPSHHAQCNDAKLSPA